MQFYYMGYYIESCRKMRYKGRYSPSYLLDLTEKKWRLLDASLSEALNEDKRFLAYTPSYAPDTAAIGNIPITGLFQQDVLFDVSSLYLFFHVYKQFFRMLGPFFLCSLVLPWKLCLKVTLQKLAHTWPAGYTYPSHRRHGHNHKHYVMASDSE